MAKRMQDGKTMMANIFEIIQLMTNYSFFLLFDESSSDLMSEEEEESFPTQKLNDEKESVVPQLKNLSAYGSKTQLDSDMDEEAQQVWQTFQKVSDSLERLNPSQYAILLKAHPIILVYYSKEIMSVLSSTISEIKPYFAGDDGNSIFQSLSTTVETVRICLVNNICQGMVQVFSTIHLFEDWSFENHTGGKPLTLHAKHDSTYLMKICYRLNKFFLKSLRGIIRFSEKAEDTNVNVESIRVALFDSLFSLLDSFQWQASQWRDPASAIHFENVTGWVPDIEHVKLKSTVPEQKAIFGQFVPPECSNFVETVKPKDHCNQDSRNFIVLCNINYLKNWMLPVILELFEEKFGAKVTMDSLHYEEMVQNLEQIIIMNYVKRQSEVIKTLVKNAVLYSGLDWATVQAPRGKLF
jgi:Exocyst complex component Sec5